MVYTDDEPIAANSTLSVDNSDFNIAGKTTATIINNTEAPLEGTSFNVMIDLVGAGSGKDRPGVDLVTVLDVSGSMAGERIDKLKIAMQFVIKKLSPIDRLSIVVFNQEVERLCVLKQITEKSQTEIENIVNGLVADGGTDILKGLNEGLQVLNDRRLTTGRVSAIMLMSDGEQIIDQLPQIEVPVHTFGVGQQYDPKVLQAIAQNSKGGTFSDVQKDNLSIAFSQCLAGLLTVVVQDLTLTVTSDASKIFSVSAGTYPRTNEFKSTGHIGRAAIGVFGSSTVSFGDLYDKELRRVMVGLILPAVILLDGTNEVGANVLEITYSYRAASGKRFNSAPRNINITRVGTSVRAEREELRNEEHRLQTVRKMKEARVLADKDKLIEATGKLVEAQNYLYDVVDDPNTLITALLSELNQLVKLMQSKDKYEKQGRSYALSSETSHDRQRSAARGSEVKKGGLYSTPRMDAYLEQAKAFVEDPSIPVPSADDDVKQEILADPLASIAGALSYYIHTAIESLKSIDNIINKRSP